MDINVISKELENIPETKNKVNLHVKELLINPFTTYDKKYLKFLHKVGGDISNMAKLIGPIEPITCGYTSDDRLYVTPHNGPTLTEGEKVPNNESYLVEKIYYSSEAEYYIFELKKS